MRQTNFDSYCCKAPIRSFPGLALAATPADTCLPAGTPRFWLGFATYDLHGLLVGILDCGRPDMAGTYFGDLSQSP